MAQWRLVEYFWNTPADGESGYIGSFSPDHTRVEAGIQVRHPTDVANAILEFTGHPYRAGSTGFRYIERHTPFPHPRFLDINFQPWLYCVSVARAEGRGLYEVGGTPRLYDWGEQIYHTTFLRLVFQSLTYEILEDTHSDMTFVPDLVSVPAEPQPNPLIGKPDEATLARYVTKWPKGFNRAISVPRTLAAFVLETGDKKAGTVDGVDVGPPPFEALMKPEPGETLQYTWHQVPREGIDRAKHRRAAGTTNKYIFDGYPPGTLMASMPDVVPIKSANGQKLVDVHFTFQFLAKVGLDGNLKGWDHFFRVSEQNTPLPSGVPKFLPDYRKLTSDGKPDTGPDYKNRIFRRTDFSDLFRIV